MSHTHTHTQTSALSHTHWEGDSLAWICVCGCVCVCVCVYVSSSVCGCVGVWVCGCVSVQRSLSTLTCHGDYSTYPYRYIKWAGAISVLPVIQYLYGISFTVCVFSVWKTWNSLKKEFQIGTRDWAFSKSAQNPRTIESNIHHRLLDHNSWIV
jgi:hypothetical protein